MKYLSEYAGTFPTPAYVFDRSLFGKRAALVKEAFGNKTDLCFSIKANPFLLYCLPKEFAKIEVCMISNFLFLLKQCKDICWALQTPHKVH